MEVSNRWPFSILWIGKAYFYHHCKFAKLQNMGNGKSIHTCTSSASFYKYNYMVWVDGNAYCRTIVFRRNGGLRVPLPALWTINVCSTRPFQQCIWLDRIIFKQDCAPPHIAKPIKELLKRHLGSNRIIRVIFQQPSLQDHQMSILDFWLWGYFKNIVLSGPIANLVEVAD